MGPARADLLWARRHGVRFTDISDTSRIRLVTLLDQARHAIEAPSIRYPGSRLRWRREVRNAWLFDEQMSADGLV